MIYQFNPSATSAYQFNPTLDGNVYNCSVTWNIFGQRYYLNAFSQSGNRIFTLPLIGSSTQPGIAPVNIAAGYFIASVVYFYPSNNQIVVIP